MKADYRIGDEVYIGCYSGHGTPGWSLITDIQLRYNEITGNPYTILICENFQFNADTGDVIKGPTAYYLTDTVRKAKCSTRFIL